MLKRKLEMIENRKMYGDGKRWKRGTVVGEGSCGKVFVAYSTIPKWRYVTDRVTEMAVKSAKVSSPHYLFEECLMLENLQGCPYIIECYGEETTTGENGDPVYNLLLEYGSFGTLAQRINDFNGGRGLPENEVSFVTKCMLSGVAHMHEQGIIHRDIRPENIILVKNHKASIPMEYIPKIGDFSSAINLERIRNVKIEPYLLGHVKYFSPAAMVANMQSQESDIWAVGCIVFEMLSGETIWEGMHPLHIENSLFRIGLNHTSFILDSPHHVSELAEDFLMAIFGTKKWTLQELLSHPFVAGPGEDLKKCANSSNVKKM